MVADFERKHTAVEVSLADSTSSSWHSMMLRQFYVETPSPNLVRLYFILLDSDQQNRPDAERHGSGSTVSRRPSIPATTIREF
jgi:hypothetical protein